MARKKSKRRDDDEDDLPDDTSGEVESLDDGLPRRRKPKDDAWTGLLAIAFLALVGATVLFYLDHAALSAQQVSPPSFTLPGLGGAAAQPG